MPILTCGLHTSGHFSPPHQPSATFGSLVPALSFAQLVTDKSTVLAVQPQNGPDNDIEREPAIHCLLWINDRQMYNTANILQSLHSVYRSCACLDGPMGINSSRRIWLPCRKAAYPGANYHVSTYLHCNTKRPYTSISSTNNNPIKWVTSLSARTTILSHSQKPSCHNRTLRVWLFTSHLLDSLPSAKSNVIPPKNIQ